MLCVLLYAGGFMIQDLYINYKMKYPNYLILIKIGNFYLSLNDDAIVINDIFHYKIKKSTNFIKTGFPLISINKVCTKLTNMEINYLIVENDNIEKIDFKNNRYLKYNKKISNYNLSIHKLNYINSIINENILNDNMINILEQIESIVCKINY